MFPLAEAIVSEFKDREEEKAHLKQALCWNGYLSWLLDGADMPPPVQPVEEGVEENIQTQQRFRQSQALQRPPQPIPLTCTKPRRDI